MTAFQIVLLVFALLVLVTGVGGFIAMTRRTRSREDELLEQLQRAERELAKAHAADKGWDPAPLHAAARAAADDRFGAGVERACSSSRSSTSPAPTPTRPSFASRPPTASSRSRSAAPAASGARPRRLPTGRRRAGAPASRASADLLEVDDEDQRLVRRDRALARSAP